MGDEDSRTLRRRDLEARKAILESSDRSMLVEAAAGTGKTTLMIGRILHGLREGRFQIPHVVAITFTEKAAGELEWRLRRELALQLHGGHLGDGQRHNLQAAAQEIDRANISTIHSFCALLLRERPIEAGVDPEFDVLDRTQAELLKEHCWSRWMSEQVQACVPALVHALRVDISITAVGRASGLKGLADAVVRFPEALDRSLFELARPGASPRQLLERLKQLAPRAARFIEGNLKRGNEHSRLLRRQVTRLLATDDASALRAAACELASVQLEQAIKSFPRESREEGHVLLARVLAPAREVAAHLACDLLDWMGGFAAFYEREKRLRSALDFQDLLLLSARMLRTNRDARGYFQRRFRAFFVDEFQDTDPLQAEVIAFLCEKPGARPTDRFEEVELDEAKLFVVGDPKQSIYRFRRADVQVYEQFKSLYRRLSPDGAAVRKVFRSFRSTPRLIADLNALFERVLTAPEREGVYQAEHVPLVHGEDAAAGPSTIAVCPPEELAVELSGAAEARKLEARHLASVLRRLVEGPLPEGLPWEGAEVPLHYGGFACLLRALTDVDIYEEAFEESGVPYRVLGGRSYYQRQEIGETLAVLRAVDDPLDQVSIVAALRSSYFALSDEDLFRYKEAGGRWDYLVTGVPDGPAGRAMGLLRDWHARRNRIAPQALLREMLDHTKAVEAFMLKPAGRRRAANLQKLMSQLRSLWAGGGGTFRSIVDYLAGLHERREAEEESSIAEPGDPFVSIMSIHKAKGLEFDAVCLPDLSRAFRNVASVGPLVLDRVARRVEVRAGKAVRSCGYDELAEREYGNLLEEEKRLLYVAATRARRLLILPLYWHSRQGKLQPCTLDFLVESGRFHGPDGVPFGRESGGVFYWDTRAEPAQTGAPAGPTEAATGDGATTDELLGRRRRWREEHDRLVHRISHGATIVLPSALVGPTEGTLESGELPGKPSGRDFGALFHNLMRRMPLPLQGGGEGLERVAAGLARIEAAAVGLGEDLAQQAARLAVSLLENAEFLSLLREAQHIRREAPFAVPLGALPFCHAGQEGFLEGSIDLLLTGQGRAVIVDYKTDKLGREDPQAAAGRYWPQLALYGLAAQVCGWADDNRPELVLCFVRHGRLVRKRIDDRLAQVAAEGLTRCLPARDRPPAQGRGS